MHVTPLTRPARNTLLRSYAATLDGHPDAVFADLVEKLVANGDDVRVAVDGDARFAAVQGGWWYRAEYRVLDDEEGSRIEHELFNVAPSWHWAGALAGRAVIADSATAFRQLLESLDP